MCWALRFDFHVLKERCRFFIYVFIIGFLFFTLNHVLLQEAARCTPSPL